MRVLNVPFEDAEFEQLSRIRRKKADGSTETWRDALLRLAGATTRGR